MNHTTTKKTFSMYYFKTVSDIWHFSDGETLPAIQGVEKKLELQRKGIRVERLYLNVPEHFELIRQTYPNVGSDWKKIYWEIYNTLTI